MKSKLKDLQFTGTVGQDRIQELLRRLGLSAAECAALIQFYGANQGETIDINAFIDFLFSGSTDGKATVKGNVISAWNIRSPELAGNLLEMYPADSTVTDSEQSELIILLTLKANELMLSVDAEHPSEFLKNLLPDDLPLKILKEDSAKAGPLEKAPLNESYQEGLVKFFTPRLPDKGETEIAEYVKKFRERPEARWEYWKELRMSEFIAEDGSGGKNHFNAIIDKCTEPLIDEVAWNIGLGVADVKYHYCSTRVARTSWLYPKGAKGEDLANLKDGGPKPGQYDLFKLMVWDLILERVKDLARKDWPQGPDHWDKTFEGLKTSLSHTPSTVEHMEKIVKKLVESPSDIFVLCEASEDIISGNPAPILAEIAKQNGAKYELLRCSVLDRTSNVVVLVKEGSFKSYQIEELLDQDGKQLGRALGVALTTKAGKSLQLVALHLPSNGYNIPTVCGEIEKRLARGTPTIVAGDLNLDLRNKKAHSKFINDRPLLGKMVEASKHLWEQGKDKGSVNKRRTAFQAQVSKINLEDFAIKDSVLVSEPGLGEISGLIGLADILPSEHCPSDHVLLTWHGNSWPSVGISF